MQTLPTSYFTIESSSSSIPSEEQRSSCLSRAAAATSSVNRAASHLLSAYFTFSSLAETATAVDTASGRLVLFPFYDGSSSLAFLTPCEAKVSSRQGPAPYARLR